jgi:hypothetical protein
MRLKFQQLLFASSPSSTQLLEVDETIACAQQELKVLVAEVYGSLKFLRYSRQSYLYSE